MGLLLGVGASFLADLQFMMAGRKFNEMPEMSSAHPRLLRKKHHPAENCWIRSTRAEADLEVSFPKHHIFTVDFAVDFIHESIAEQKISARRIHTPTRAMISTKQKINDWPVLFHVGTKILRISSSFPLPDLQ